jgi:hypothetical protein
MVIHINKNHLAKKARGKCSSRAIFEQSETNPQPAVLQAALVNNEAPASLTASQKPDHGCPELGEIAQKWPKLPANMRLAILALIRATLNQ